FTHQDIPLPLLWTGLGQRFELPKRVVEAPHISFDLQMDTDPIARVDGLTIRREPLGATLTKIGLWIVVLERPDGLKIVAQYAVDWIGDESVDEMLGRMRTLLQHIVSTP